MADTYWYLTACPELMGLVVKRLRALGGAIMKSPATLAVLLERFFTQRLMSQQQVSPHMISSYRDISACSCSSLSSVCTSLRPV